MTAVSFSTVARRGGGWLPLIATSALVGTGVTLALPTVLGHALDATVAGSGAARWVAVAAALVALGVLADLLGGYADTAGVAGAAAWLRERLVRHVLAVGPRAGFTPGDLVSRVSANAVDAARAGPSAVAVITASVPPIGSLLLLALIEPWLAAAFLVGLALVAVVLRAFTRHTAEVFGAYQRVQGGIAARLAEALTGARTIAAAGTAAREEHRVLAALPELRAYGVRTWRVLARTSGQAAVVGPLVLVAVLAVGGLALAAGRITAGDLFAASRYASIGVGLGGLTGTLAALARARAGVRRAGEVLAAPATRYGDRTLPTGPGALELRGVTVRAGDTTLLHGVDLAVPGGAAVAVVGRSGAGKSVLAEVAARLRDPDEGEVRLDGVPLRELSHGALRAAVGCAFERPVLVGGTVADAVGLGLSRDRVRGAALATHADDFVSRLPGGYDTPLAEAPMSGGERQRLGLARAWPAERLLVLDDATSSVDTVTEAQIARTLTGAARGRTRLIVTHRAATAARADLVVWLDAGRVRAVGTDAALRADPAYREVFA
ncbi:ABC transporter ATP-binding protein [Actinomycetes bacterium KLBMP 9797]